MMGDVDGVDPQEQTRSQWVRARRPHERLERVDAIKAATFDLLEAGSAPADISVSSVAVAADMSPAGLYTYFSSRDEILVELATDEIESWLGDLSMRLNRLARTDASAVADAVVASVHDRRPLLILMSALSQLLTAERSERQRELKARLRIGLDVLEARFASILPGVDAERATRLLRSLIVGLWSFTTSDPGAPTEEESSWFELELRHGCVTLLRGLADPEPEM